MKKIKKLLNKLNNNGSSMVMVIVCLAFMGIIVGALLTAVGYSYRLKLQDLNSRDNFYYVEQAMNEIYAGVGSETVKDMQEAYAYTVENMVYYDLETKSYVTKPMTQVQKDFEQRFMNGVLNNPKLTNAVIANTLESYISNDSVKLDASKLYVDQEFDPNDASRVTKIIIKNVTLTRTQDYNKNIAAGSYTQTISTDIEIGEPDFDVLFNATDENYANIFKYSMVADMGVEVTQPAVPLTITGNVYAASDYYNKKYNEYDSGSSGQKFASDETYTVTSYDEDGNPVNETVSLDIYTHGSVSSKKYATGVGNVNAINGYYNSYVANTLNKGINSESAFNGENERSMYSGFFIDDSNVTVMADMVIVPGTVAVMNQGELSIFSKNGGLTDKSEIWADNFVLGGTSGKKVVTNAQNKKTNQYSGSTAVIKADAYIKDDTELNAAGSSFSMGGRYYGYGDSTEKDNRVFVPSVAAENFQILEYNADGSVASSENRGHYNSSSIIINGQQASLNLLQTELIYLAGRSYIELSKDVTSNEVVATSSDADFTVSETYEFAPTDNNFLTAGNATDTVFIRDYKTGESISVKSNQLAYIPILFKGMPEAVYEDGVFQYFEAEIDDHLKGSKFFNSFFPESVFEDQKVPCVVQEISGKKYYYYDFETAYNMIKASNAYSFATAFPEKAAAMQTFDSSFPSAQYYASAFITEYVRILNLDPENVNDKKDPNFVIREYLTDIGDFDEVEFEPGQIQLPTDNPNAIIYSSGAMTTKSDIYSNGALTTKIGTEFEIVQSANWNPTAIARLLSTSPYINGIAYSSTGLPVDSAVYSDAYKFSNNLELEYELVKWNLGHYNTTSSDSQLNSRNQAEIRYVQKLIQDNGFGVSSMTPINKFLNMEVITDSTSISPAIASGDSGAGILDLGSGYSVWVSNDDVTVDIKDGSSDTAVRGIVVTKGDVKFDPAVTSFEGLIISGGKIFITENLSNMYSSPAICMAILRECQLDGSDEAKTVLNLFKGYEVSENGTGGSAPIASSTNASDKAKTIDSIDYSDVCRFSNWMKNVE